MTKTEHDKLNEHRRFRLKRALSILILEKPFFGVLATRLKNMIEPNMPKSAMTNGKMTCWNHEFIDELSDAQLRGVMAHEVSHCAFGHLWRVGHRNIHKWNKACDYVINGMLQREKFELPDNAEYPTPEQASLSAEAIYSQLPDEPEGENEGENEAFTFGDFTRPADAPSGSQDEQKNEQKNQDPSQAPSEPQNQPQPKPPENLEAEWRQSVASAAVAAKMKGDLPAGLERFIENMLDPKVPWTTVLQEFVVRSAKNDYNWSRPNRRYLQSGFVMPTAVSDELPETVIAIDTSGSIGSRELDAFAAEISAVLASFNTTIHVIYADTQVMSEQVFTQADLPLKLEPKGGGGTSFLDALGWPDRKEITPAVFLYLTDGYGDWENVKEPSFPLMWVCTTDKKAPVGETVRLELD